VTVGTAFQPIGVAVGYVLPVFFVSNADSEPENVDQAKMDIYESLFWQGVLGTIIFLFVAVFLREKPPSPPSSTEA